jgi:hypothetical protein
MDKFNGKLSFFPEIFIFPENFLGKLSIFRENFPRKSDFPRKFVNFLGKSTKTENISSEVDAESSATLRKNDFKREPFHVLLRKRQPSHMDIF